MADPLRGVEIHIGGQTRTIRYTMSAFRIAEKLLGGRSLRDAVQDMGVGSVVDLATAGMVHLDKRVTPERVTAWLEQEPEKFAELANAVGAAITEAYMRMVPKDMRDEVGEETETTTAPAASPVSGATMAGQTSPGSSDSSVASE